jgi:HSP20 family protein
MASHDPAITMWAEACAMLERGERLRRQFFGRSSPAAWEPPVDMFETDRELLIVVALPGVAAGQVEIVIADGVLIVAGERSLPIAGRAAIHRLEIPHGRFERRIPLPAGRYALDGRELADGCLSLRLRTLR